MSRCPSCRCNDCECVTPEAVRELKTKLDEIYERAAELSRLMEDGDCDSDDLIKFVENLAAKEAP